MSLPQEEVTLQDVLEAVNDGFSGVENRMGRIETRLDKVESEIGSIKGEIGSMKSDITSIKATMVTKDYLDIKMADLKGEIIVTIRKEDLKLATLVDMLMKKSLITKDDAKQILSLEPFPHLAI